MAEVIAGRDAELASLRDFVESVSGGAVALVLEGEAGMGKTTLWRAAVEHADELGLVVLQAQPVESETTLSFAGVGDLLDPVLDVALERLPAAQRNALSRALALGDEEGPAVEPRALRVALMTVLRRLADERPVLVAIDDSQWLDDASSAGLAYGLRRFRAERIGVLLARRSGHESALLDELLRSPARERLTRVHVGPLDAASLGRVVQEHLGASLPRPLLAEVHQAAGGSPFYALEIVRMLQRSDISIEAGHPLPVPESLHDLVRGRLLALPRESRDFLLAAAAHAHPTIALTEAASQVTREAGLVPALEARLVELDGDRIRFTHPLLAAGAYETGDPLRRNEIHARLAELLEDPEARAWQLAACAIKPDAEIAATLAGAADHARARGALRPAALLLDRARELTPADRGDEAVRRGVEAAYLHFESGDSPRAEAQLRELIAPLRPSPERAKALAVLARIRLYEAPGEAKGLFLQVLDEAGDDAATLAIAHEGVAACSVWMYERFDEAITHSDIALALAADIGDDALTADILMTRIGAETLLGRDTASAVAERALALQSSATDLRVLDQPLVALAEYWTWIDAQARARHTLIALMQRAEELGDENARPFLAFLLGQAESALGNLETARKLAREAREAAEQSGQPLFGALGLALECMVLASMGRVEEAVRAAVQLRDVGSEHLVRLIQFAGLGHLNHSRGRPSDAVADLAPCVSFARREQIIEPGATRFVIDQVEALIELGHRDEAVELLDWYEGNARRLGRVSAQANCARCRGLLAAQAGELEDALAFFAQALELQEQVMIPLDRGRTLLALGAAQRRAKRRRVARTTLEEALATFEGIGAALWAERARAELRRISGRAATPGALTPAEERVAALVAEGKTNREVAAALFLSDRTVEGHLAHIFGKLGIRHRTEIAGALASLQTQGIAAPNTGDSPVSAGPSAP
jgi:DNA-binding CsgD family transcriptional regulator